MLRWRHQVPSTLIVVVVIIVDTKVTLLQHLHCQSTRSMVIQQGTAASYGTGVAAIADLATSNAPTAPSYCLTQGSPGKEEDMQVAASGTYLLLSNNVHGICHSTASSHGMSNNANNQFGGGSMIVLTDGVIYDGEWGQYVMC
jgi:hypothetical protein